MCHEDCTNSDQLAREIALKTKSIGTHVADGGCIQRSVCVNMKVSKNRIKRGVTQR
jgi:hypothetical protein